MATIRGFAAEDLDALYAIALETGQAGQDASALHSDGELIGHIYAAPYAILEPEQTIVAVDDAGETAGYIVGTFDTELFNEQQERLWWPALRARFAPPLDPKYTAADRQRIAAIHAPHKTPAALVEAYPAHIHMNLRSSLRGRGVGTKLVQQWIMEARDAGVKGIHLGANDSNTGGIAFWQKAGFEKVQTVGTTVWFGMKFD